MLKLLALGGATILDDGGATLAAPRQTVALLAALAVAGPAGLSRDKLVGLFWPDTDSERARHALTQAMYAARRSLRCDDLFVVGADIRFNEARIDSDVAQFEREIGAGRFSEAVALYRGAFLDGFFASSAPEFERWASIQRTRLEDEFATVLTRLGGEARAANDTRHAVDWFKRLAVVRPLDSGVAVAFMEALAASGDRAGAIQYANVHRALLRQELEIEPDPSVDDLARRLREARSEAVEPAISIARDAASASNVEIISKPGDEVGPSSAPSAPMRRARFWRVFAPATAAVLLVSAGFAIGRSRQENNNAPRTAPQQRLVVAPFRVAGTSESLRYLREGLVELLSTRLADESFARSVDPGAVLGAWRAAGILTANDVSRDTVVRLAARLGAERVLVGSVVGTPSRLIVRATLINVPSAVVAGEATIEGSADSLAYIVDRLAAKLLVAEAGEDERLAIQTTKSLPALRAFLAGQAAFRRSNYSVAMREYGRALARDSSFALAALRLAITAERLDDAGRTHRALVAAWRHREALSTRDRALLGALAGERFPAPSTRSAQVGEWQHVVDLAPSSAEAWFSLGARLFHDGALAGVPTPNRRSRTAFERALAADPEYVPAARVLTLLSVLSDANTWTPAADVTIGLDDSLSPFAPFLRWRMAVARGDARALREIRAEFERIGPANLRQIVMASQFDAIGHADADLALRALRARTLGTTERSELLFAEHSVAMNRGRRADALAATERLRTLAPGSHAYLRLRVLDALYGDGDTVAAVRAAGELAAITASGRSGMPSTIDSWLSDLCVLTQWRLARNDTTGAGRAIAELRAVQLTDQTMLIVTAPAACAELLDVNLAVVTRRRDAKAALARLDSLALTRRVAGDAAAYAPLLISRLHEQLGDDRAALSAIRRRVYMTGWPRYLATMLREEHRLAELALDVDGAREANRRYLALRNADVADDDPPPY